MNPVLSAECPKCRGRADRDHDRSIMICRTCRSNTFAKGGKRPTKCACGGTLEKIDNAGFFRCSGCKHKFTMTVNIAGIKCKDCNTNMNEVKEQKIAYCAPCVHRFGVKAVKRVLGDEDILTVLYPTTSGMSNYIMILSPSRMMFKKYDPRDSGFFQFNDVDGKLHVRKKIGFMKTEMVPVRTVGDLMEIWPDAKLINKQDTQHILIRPGGVFDPALEITHTIDHKRKGRVQKIDSFCFKIPRQGSLDRFFIRYYRDRYHGVV